MTVLSMDIYEGLGKRERSSMRELCCELEDPLHCDFYRENRCLEMGTVLGRDCLWSRYRSCSSHVTKMARAYDGWLSRAKERVAEFRAQRPAFRTAPKRIARIGEDFYLPFSHIMLCEKQIPFGHGTGGIGCPMFLRVEDFTADNIMLLLRLKPMPIFGFSEIKAYQQQEVPKFLYQLKVFFPHLYAEVLSRDESLAARTPSPNSFAGRQVPVGRCAPNPKLMVALRADRQVEAAWDGQNLSAEIDLILSVHAAPGTTPRVVWEPAEDEMAIASTEDLQRLYDTGAFAGIRDRG
jgi:hypothetical protein